MIMDLMLKNWPVNMWIQTPMDMIHSIVTKNDVDPDKIKLIEISPFIPNRSEDSPADGYDSMVAAQFSIPFCMAMYLKGPKVGTAWLEEEYLKDPEILKMASKVKGIGEKSLISSNFAKFQEGSYPSYAMRVTMEDGTVYEEAIQFPKGHPQNPYTRQECIDCFKLATGGLMSEEKQDVLCDYILRCV